VGITSNPDTVDRLVTADLSYFALGYHTPALVYVGDVFRYKFFLPAVPAIYIGYFAEAGVTATVSYRAEGCACTEAFNLNLHTWGPVAHNLVASGARTLFCYDIWAVLTANGFAAGDYCALELEAITIVGGTSFMMLGLRVNDILY
jgi:hypothetical protein